MISNSIYHADGVNKLLETGDRVKLINEAYWEAGRQSRVIGYEYNLDFPYDSPMYTVGETAPYSKIGELEGKVESLTYKGQAYSGGKGSGIYLIRANDNTPATDSNAYSARRTQLEFLSRIKECTAEERITFLKGLAAEGLIKAKNGLEVVGGTSTDSLNASGDISGKNISANEAVSSRNVSALETVSGTNITATRKVSAKPL